MYVEVNTNIQKVKKAIIVLRELKTDEQLALELKGTALQPFLIKWVSLEKIKKYLTNNKLYDITIKVDE